MRAKRSLAALALAALLAVSALLGGCTQGEEQAQGSAATAEPSAQAQDGEQEQRDVLGVVSYIGSSYLSVTEYTAPEKVDDYTALDVSTLTQADDTAVIRTDTQTDYYRVQDGELEEITREDIGKGDLIAAGREEDVQWVIRIRRAALEAQVAEVTAVSGDGTLTLVYWQMQEDYAITDLADVDLSQFTSTQETREYTLPEDASVKLSASGLAVAFDAGSIEAGDVLVIHENPSTGAVSVVVYRQDGGESVEEAEDTGE